MLSPQRINCKEKNMLLVALNGLLSKNERMHSVNENENEIVYVRRSATKDEKVAVVTMSANVSTNEKLKKKERNENE